VQEAASLATPAVEAAQRPHILRSAQPRAALAGERCALDILAVAPGLDTTGPARDLGRAVAAAIELARTVQAAIDEVRGEIHRERPFDRVGADQRDIVLAQELDEGRIAKAFVTNLEGVAQRSSRVRPQPGARPQAMVMAASAGCRCLGIARQQGKEGVELRAIEAEAGRKLPQDRPQLGPEPQEARGDEVGERRPRLVEALHVRQEARALYGEDEIVRRRLGPAGEGVGPLHAVKSSVDLDARENRAGMRQFPVMRQALGIETTAPWCVGPARDADANLARARRSMRAHRLQTPTPMSGCMSAHCRPERSEEPHRRLPRA